MKTENNLSNEEITDETKVPNYYVAIGASAGGLEAIDLFFSKNPHDTGMAYIVIQHLSPDYKSLMVELLSKKTLMKVHRAENNMLVESDNVYLIPPKKNLSIFHGKLLLSDQDHTRGVNLPIDLFFKSLAEDQGEKAIGIVLSGTGSDGTRGLRVIKENGGMVMVQKEDTAKFDGMPKAAIATGLADFILAPELMPEQLKSFAKHPYAAKPQRSEILINDEEGLTRIFSLLREKCKVDFTFYKPSTITRRIERRMAINQTDNISDYVNYLIQNPGEINSLYRELLIGVTSFFRDQEAFDALRDKWFGDVFESSQNQEVRFWTPGCSTGEEAYSLAMLAREYMEEKNINYDVKIFATDIDKEALHFAAAGVYPESIAADLPAKFISKYFFKKDEHFQVSRSIREMVVFAQHNLVKDPPFTNISLISCRNLLIYLQPVLQRKVFEYFNFSLKPGAILFLGTSESTSDMADYFDQLEPKWKIYKSRGRNKNYMESAHVLSITDTRSRDAGDRFRSIRRAIRSGEDEKVLDRFIQTVSDEYIPLSLIINDQLEVIHVLGDPRNYLKVPTGKMSNDVSKMAINELSVPLTTGVQKVFRQGKEVRFSNIKIINNDNITLVDLRILPIVSKKGQEDLVVAIIGETKKIDNHELNQTFQSYDLSKEAEERLKDLEQDLQFTRENLQATIEELETSNEELQATNEELLASNEELQSTNEELQSTNEELFTVNAEYQNKIIELTELHNDVENILNASQISFLLLDENLDIRRFSPNITKLFNLLNHDLGRPINHISNYIKNVDPIHIINEVQISAKPIEKEIKTQDDKTYLMIVEPYQIAPKSYSGIILSFVDITSRKESELEFKKLEDRFQILFNTMSHGVVFQKSTGEIISANPAAEEILGLSLEQLQGKKSIDKDWGTITIDGEDLPGELHPAMIALKTGKNVPGTIMGVKNPKSNSIKWINVVASPLFKPEQAAPYMVYAVFEDITDKIQADLELKENAHRLDLAMEKANLAWWEMDCTTGQVLFSPRKAEMLGFPADKFSHYNDFMELVHPDDYQPLMTAMHDHLTGKADAYNGVYRIKNISGLYKWFKDTGSIIRRDSNGAPLKVAGIVIDITEFKDAQLELNKLKNDIIK